MGTEPGIAGGSRLLQEEAWRRELTLLRAVEWNGWRADLVARPGLGWLEWKREAEHARQVARERGLDQAAIDRAIHDLRYLS
jgi:hypothetical protein